MRHASLRLLVLNASMLALLGLTACAQPPSGAAQIRDDTRTYDVPDRGMKDSRAP